MGQQLGKARIAAHRPCATHPSGWPEEAWGVGGVRADPEEEGCGGGAGEGLAGHLRDPVSNRHGWGVHFSANEETGQARSDKDHVLLVWGDLFDPIL
eukprot:1159567-Pelagomonas_calceolata.AAC.3